MNTSWIGLDIGGANLKRAEANGSARSLPFALWKQPERLATALRELLADVSDRPLAVTMTGELCDCFLSKRAGVVSILNALCEASTMSKRIWTIPGGFVTIKEALNAPLAAAASNWHALATFVASETDGTGILVDLGSTTCDIIPIDAGKVVAHGQTDSERLRSGELVYLGATRTPACALLANGVCNEWFATTADVFVRLGWSPERPECVDTADGRPLTQPHAHSRLSRMLGGDAETTPEAETLALAEAMANAALRRIAEGLSLAARRPDWAVVSGSGAFLAERALRQWMPRLPIVSFAEHHGVAASESACAFALARLAG